MENAEKLRKRYKARGYLHDMGKLFVDIAKLSFGSLVLGTVIRWDVAHTTIFVLGVIFSMTVAAVGIIMARIYEEG